MVILVDNNDNEIGVMEKMQAHQQALLHRAFSVFLFNNKGEMLLQKRAIGKYHSGGLWTNTCCSHPAPQEPVLQAAHRRLKEEMGISTTLNKAFSFVYKATLDNDLTEYEFDHVLTGTFEGNIIPNKEEVSDWKFQAMNEIEKDLKINPSHYTEWFKLIFSHVKEYIASPQYKSLCG